jgi:tRNA(fMet)-specific endonuclease VapC
VVKRHLLDSNVWILHWKNPAGKIAQRLAKFRSDELATCSIVRAELLHGAKKYGNAIARAHKVTIALSALDSLPFDDESADQFATIKHDLELRGVVIGPYDLQIAAICLQHDLTLVTNNVGEFSRVPGLRVEDWTV